PTPGGGWALLLLPREYGQWRFTAAHGARAGNEVLARESGGPRAPSAPWMFDQRNDQWDESFLIIRGTSVFDFDGDGEPEFVLRQSSASRGGARTWLSAFRFVGGRAVPFPLPDGAQDLEDVDGDGRPDVVIEHRAFEWMSCETGSDRGTEGVEAPRTVARSLPGGTFSVRDPAVAAENLRECGPRPARIVARDADGVVDDEATARNVVCAGAWGVPRAQIVAALRTCRDFAPTRECDEAMDARRTNECRHRRVLLEWAGWFP
ncbi:MAG: VCBS repeat-containing protein, partial [Deltaproteobacteria bacterium]|nr:VCBS repeat-containing protein [Deltaproteobacteria bacterium]